MKELEMLQLISMMRPLSYGPGFSHGTLTILKIYSLNTYSLYSYLVSDCEASIRTESSKQDRTILCLKGAVIKQEGSQAILTHDIGNHVVLGACGSSA